MKQFFLFVLTWTLAISQNFAQNVYPAPMQQKIENLPQSVKKLVAGAGIHSKSQQVTSNRVQGNTQLQLDSIKTFSGYALSAGLDSTPQSRSIFQYPQQDVEVQTDAEFINGEWVPVNKTSTTIDALGRPVESLSEFYDTGTEHWFPETWTFIEYHANSQVLIDSLLVLEWDANNSVWSLAFKTKNIYNAQDRLETALTTYVLNGEEGLFIQEYTYDANGDNTLIETSLVSSGFMFPFSKQELQYANHHLIQTIDYMMGGLGVFEPANRNTYFYNAAQQLAQLNTYEYVMGVNDWRPSATQFFEYDNQGRLTSNVVITHDPINADQKQKTAYDYIQDENLALESDLFWDPVQNKYFLTDRSFYYYSGGSTPVRPQPQVVDNLQIVPNPAVDNIRLSLETEATVQVFDMSGHLLLSTMLMPNEALDLSALPSGIYQLSARESARIYTGKLLKL